MKNLILALLLFPLIGCTDASCAKEMRYRKSKVQLWSGGKAVQEWISSGRVEEDKSGAGYYFVDGATNKMVRVQGDVSIVEVE